MRMRAASLLPLYSNKNRTRQSRLRIPRCSYRLLYLCTAIVGLCVFLSLFDLPELSFEFAPPLYDFGPLSRPNVDPLVWEERASRVRAAFVSTYKAYEESAYPHDELLPKTNSSKDP